MDNNIKKWLTHMNTTTGRKRKREDNDMLLNELMYNSIESIIKQLSENKIRSSEFNNYLTNLELIFTGTRKLFDQDPKIKNNKDIYLFLNACISVSLNIICKLKEEKSKTKRFNAIKFLNKYKEEFYVCEPNRKLTNTSIDLVYDANIGLFCELETEPEGSEGSEGNEGNEGNDEYDPNEEGSEYDYNHYNERTNKFINKLDIISDNTKNSKKDMINYFNKMTKQFQTATLNNLNKISNVNSNNIPYIFRIIQSPLDATTKQHIISKILYLQTHGVNENGKDKKWVDNVMKLPFGIYKGLNLDTMKNKPVAAKRFLNNLEQHMNDAVYGHDDAKKQIIRIMGQQIRNPQCKGNVIGIYGVPGNGKTSIIKDGIAKAMNKPFIFISLGGVTDGAYLDGHSYTYEGSIYGRIAQALIDAKCMNPVIYFDELDKVSRCHKGDEIINMLIHLVDPVQNQFFRDKYFYNIDIDLSKVTFIFSFNDPHEVNYILRERITMIETKYLTNAMKLHIGMNHILPEILRDMKMSTDDIIISETIMTNIIVNYTDEGGVRKLKTYLYRIVRELNHMNLTNKQINFPIILTDNQYDEIFKNIAKVNHIAAHKKDGIGMVNGLWANSMGCGGVLPIESILIPGKEKLEHKTTGMLGKIIKESIDVALSLAWNLLSDDIRNMWMNRWNTKPECFHLHCPDGSTDKDGPSAGAAMTLAFYSTLTNKQICHNVAMTGEINLRGEVTAIGGLDEKLHAAKRAGIKLVLIPRENTIDLNNVIKNNSVLLDDNFKIECVDTIKDIITYALL